MWNCHSWPLDVSSNVKLPFLTKWALIDNIEQWRVDSTFWHFLKEGGLHLPDHPLPLPLDGTLLSILFFISIWYGIPVHVAGKLICLTIGLWIFLSKDNVLLLLQYMGGQLAVWAGRPENLKIRFVKLSCSLIMGGSFCLLYIYVLY